MKNSILNFVAVMVLVTVGFLDAGKWKSPDLKYIKITDVEKLKDCGKKLDAKVTTLLKNVTDKNCKVSDVSDDAKFKKENFDFSFLKTDLFKEICETRYLFEKDKKKTYYNGVTYFIGLLSGEAAERGGISFMKAFVSKAFDSSSPILKNMDYRSAIQIVLDLSQKIYFEIVHSQGEFVSHYSWILESFIKNEVFIKAVTRGFTKDGMMSLLNRVVKERKIKQSEAKKFMESLKRTNDEIEKTLNHKFWTKPFTLLKYSNVTGKCGIKLSEKLISKNRKRKKPDFFLDLKDRDEWYKKRAQENLKAFSLAEEAFLKEVEGYSDKK